METSAETPKKWFRINVRNFNFFTLLSILFIIAGLGHYIYWGTRYGVWSDIGIYSITVVLVIPGIIGIILTLMDEKEKED